ncbi:MAG: uroporphyrinogen decarboxylase family protein, partial [Chloroflexota bacterium]|nr:uroporphyrinogen decarboxylase family protein [Chloroflexota bacterium]
RARPAKRPAPGPSRGPAHLEKLVERVQEAAADPKYAQRKQMYTRHNRLEKAGKAPVCVHLHKGYRLVWQELIPPDTLISQEPLERDIELQLRQKLYKHDHIPDDEVLLPTVWVTPVRPGEAGDSTEKPSSRDEHQTYGSRSRGEARLWGLPFQVRRTESPGGAYKVEPVVQSEADMARLHHPTYEVGTQATRVLCERATELVGGRLPVKIAGDEVSASPSETMVSLMGIEAVLYGVIDRPAFIHKMMDFITDGYIAYHRSREAAGAVEAEESWGFRTHYEELPPGAEPHRLTSSWWYISAQSLAGLSPAMYEEFLQPYHARLAEALADQRVYYHGCEDLTKKIPIIRKLPNLRRFHVSPWTNLESAVAQLDRQFVLETHVSYADVLYVQKTPTQMREAVERIMKIAGHCVLDVNLGDIETVRGDPSVLTRWAQAAQDVTARYA